MIPICEMTIGEFGAYVATLLKENGIDVTLTGGSCVAIYTHNKFTSNDLDFINNGIVAHKMIVKSLTNRGFELKDRYLKHPDSDFYVEFPSGPLMVGGEYITKTDTLDFATGTLKILTPTDCVKDRLSHFFFWNDHQGLEQAIAVSQSNVVAMDEIERWAENEGLTAEFERIRHLF